MGHPQIQLCRKATEQTHLSLALRTTHRADSRRYALRLLNAVLGENMSSRLFQVVRETHGLAYNIQSATSFWADAGDLVISAGVEHRELMPALKLVFGELTRLAARPVGAAEFQRARDYVVGQMDLALESTESQMMTLAEQLLGYGQPISPQRVRRELAAVTPKQIQACAREFFRPERSSLACIGPHADARRLERLLTNWAR